MNKENIEKDMLKKIPIFPLSLVVFPASKYSLHIFEERYKKMVNRCLDKNSGFGIVTVLNKEDVYKIGSYVKISRIIKEFNNGELDIIVKGVDRFLMNKIELHAHGYFEAVIESYPDRYYDIDQILVAELQKKFENILEKVKLELEPAFWTNFFRTHNKSYKVAEKSGLTLEQQHQLLTLQDENTRITYLIDHFEKIDSQISDDGVLNNIVMGDGYINDLE